VQAFDQVRIRQDLDAGKPKTLSAYLDELLSPAEQAERSEEQFFAKLERQMMAAANED
jgi:hypothetical protein